MKKNVLAFVTLIAILVNFYAFSQNEEEPVALGLPGDNLNLYAVLDIFQKSPTLEAFEKSINDNETKINNLDLNNDQTVDYIKVVSYKEGDGYSIVLRVAVNEKENHDVAVIEVNKNKSGKAIVQIIGDEELYGKDYIIEPTTDKGVSGTPNPGYVNTQVYYANDWPIVNLMFSPGFVLYSSPWYWGYYPPYWNPWPPILYFNYWGFHRHYYNNLFFRRHTYLRYPSHFQHYTNIRNRSNIVIRNRAEGNYRGTYGGRSFKQPNVPGPSRRPDGSPRIQRNRGELPNTRQPIPRGTTPNSQQARPRGTTPKIQQAKPRVTTPNSPQARPRGNTPKTQQAPKGPTPKPQQARPRGSSPKN